MGGGVVLIDLDAARAARAELNGEHSVVRFGGEMFDLPAECPLDFILALNDDEPKTAVEALVGEQWERFWAHRPSREDIRELARGVADAYGLGGGMSESPASGGSSKTGGRRSRRTSLPTTESTSAKPASEQTALEPAG
jgi:hypothetical protein